MAVMATTQLFSLPQEIHLQIIEGLDPISLISLSQSCRYFRQVIQPTRSQFVQRLLALEVLEEYGGPRITVRAKGNRLAPPFTDVEAWEKKIRFACVGCLRLLGHKHFDNHSILRLGLRKPPPEAPAARQLEDCWTPPNTDRKAKWLRTQRRMARDREELRFWRKQYHEATARHDHLDFPPGNATAMQEHIERCEQLECEAELQLIGRHRHKRMCNECRFKAGHWSRPTTSNIGSAHVPIVKSRQYTWKKTLDRYFPGLVGLPVGPDGTTPIRHPPLNKVYRTDAEEDYEVLYMVRCPACETWQEFAAFRVGMTELKGAPKTRHDDDSATPAEMANSIRCNACVAREGGVAELAHEIYEYWDAHALAYLLSTIRGLTQGWILLRRICPRPYLKNYRPAIDKALTNLPFPLMIYWNSVKVDWEDLTIEETDLEDLKRRIAELKVALHGDVKVLRSVWGESWLERYEDHDRYYRWLRGRLQEMRGQPERLVDYVLHVNPYRT